MNRTAISMDMNRNRFHWDLETDAARLTDASTSAVVWRGGLLPSFELVLSPGSTAYADARVSGVSQTAPTIRTLDLDFGEYGAGTLQVVLEPWGIRFASLAVDWRMPVGIVAMHFGSRRMTATELQRAPRLDKAFWPSWRAERYCIPCAGTGPTRSMFRAWDLGDATLPLGSFGGATGSLYAGAFPRPLYAAAMGEAKTWLAFGPGVIPDAPLSLKVQGSTASLHYAYREDLWQPSDPQRREWREPLRIAAGESAYDAYDRLYRTFPVGPAKHPRHFRTFLCTWGDFRLRRFDLKGYADRVAQTLPAEMIVIDDPWESSMGSGEPNAKLFPEFDRDIDYLKAKGYAIALWQSVGWIDRPEEFGLDDNDLLCGADGKPRLWTWAGDPIAGTRYHYCLDPSSERARTYLTDRTERLVKRYGPVALKLDFGYGFPGPDAAVPRDPALRGERLCAELLRIVGAAAKAVSPDITIIYYGLHPLLHPLTDMINIDDLGDAGESAAYERSGHNQRCMWAALAAAHGMPVNTSTGYFAGAVESILLDTAVVGANGLTLGEFDSDGQRMTETHLCRWHALERWGRRTSRWKPLWLDADPGISGEEPSIISWGRVEDINGSDRITALALRGSPEGETAYDGLAGIRFSGQWAIVSQDERDVFETKRLACIPFSPGTISIDRTFTAVESYRLADGRAVLAATETAAETSGTSLALHADPTGTGPLVGFVVTG
ncbi:hypothetical protein ACFFNY_16215 [Paenibacillus hodogayensis]|uniref:Glycoside hydrolase n=1 Tax=Paenibacillus hodogayensis TaxID=279208 RepID=A0ABV5VYR1_9BACL